MAWLHPDFKLAERELSRARQMLLSKFGSRWYLSNADVEDLVQETFKRVVQNVAANPKIRDIVAIAEKYKYVHGVANNVLKEKVDVLKKKTKWETRLEEESPIPGQSEDSEDFILTGIEQPRLLACLEKCIQKELSPVERIMIKFFAESDSHYAQKLAGKFGLSPGALRTRISRIISEKLRPCMKKYGAF